MVLERAYQVGRWIFRKIIPAFVANQLLGPDQDLSVLSCFRLLTGSLFLTVVNNQLPLPLPVCCSRIARTLTGHTMMGLYAGLCLTIGMCMQDAWRDTAMKHQSTPPL